MIWLFLKLELDIYDQGRIAKAKIGKNGKINGQKYGKKKDHNFDPAALSKLPASKIDLIMLFHLVLPAREYLRKSALECTFLLCIDR